MSQPGRRLTTAITRSLCGLLRIGFLANEADPRTKLYAASAHSNNMKMQSRTGHV